MENTPYHIDLDTCQRAIALAARFGSAGQEAFAPQAFINLCQNRSNFQCALIAALIAKRKTLLPPNAATGTQQDLAARYQALILHDGNWTDTSVASLDVSKVSAVEDDEAQAKVYGSLESIADSFIAAIVHTSGSTGKPVAIEKTWRTLQLSSFYNKKEMLGQFVPELIVATVPAQHMWGFETSVLIPLFSDIALHPGQPFFPHDIAQTLQNACRNYGKVCLVSTPVHLRALIQSGISLPKIDRILCATAPLDQALAKRCEESLGCPLIEIYGCSEVGSIANRRTAVEQTWQLFEQFTLAPQKGTTKADEYSINTSYLAEPVVLNDTLQVVEGTPLTFKLAGRRDDLIEIGGKKQRLSAISAVALRHPSITDAHCFLLPTDKSARPRVALAIETKDTSVTKTTLKAWLANYIDPLFVPKAIRLVPKLPREANSKISKAALLALFDSREL